MIPYKTTNNALFFSSIDEIPNKIWEDLQCKKNVYFNPLFLKPIEKNHPDITFAYIVLVDNDNSAIAFSSIKVINFYINSIQKDFDFLKKLGKKIGILKEKKPLKILVSGNVFVSGEHGLFIKKNQNKNKVIVKLTKAIHNFVNSNQKFKNKIDAFLIKDFINNSLPITNELKYLNYNAFSVEPNMVLHLNENWQSFNDYLAAMKTKFRVKARKAYKQSAILTTEDVTLKSIKNKIVEMTALYKKVIGNAHFNLSNFNLETYINLKENLGKNYILKAFYLDDKMVGFMSGIINKNCLDAHFVGIDYELNRTYAIYQKMLYTYVEIAIEKQLKTINFGRTASEIKSSIGAVPEDLTMYLRHKKTLTNKILKLFLQRIQPTEFKQKFPFKS